MISLKKTYNCNDLGKKHIGSEVILNGWVQKRRDHGGVIFIDLRDRTGIVQIAVNPEFCSSECFHLAEGIRSEYVLGVKGTVKERPQGMENEKIPTGYIDVIAEEIIIFSSAKTPPFYIQDGVDVDENIRLKYRYIDLRRPEMQRNLILRHKAIKACRDFLDEHGFLEIETPILMRSTPEGARDFLVPSRINAGKFYALPQSPQQYKQLLMVSGFEKYFQIARCFRDEDLRADRQPEFTQLDLEMSFVDEEDIMELTEEMLAYILNETLDYKVETPFSRLTWKEAMDRFGSDKPDVRFGLELVDLSDLVGDCSFKVFSSAVKNGGVVKAINAKGFADLSRREIDALTEYVGIYGAKGLAYFVIEENGIKSPITKFIDDTTVESICERMNAQPGDIIFFGADSFQIVSESLGHLRLKLAHMRNMIDEKTFNFVWVTEFPLLEWNPDIQRFQSVHHPFTAPIEKDMSEYCEYPEKIRSRAYDVVLNGVELGGGSVRIHDRNMQMKMFDLLGLQSEMYEEQFATLLQAFEYGAPPHAGIAFGLDRMLMLMSDRESIRDVIAFPKTQSAVDLMADAPAPVDEEQLADLHVQLDLPEAE